MPVSPEDIKVGVYICYCGKNIAGKINVKEVVKAVSKAKFVSVAKDYFFMCSKTGQEIIKKIF